jgi:UDP-N-acetylglucosamine--dolichyl-phosphate N-acetylglucosaminephosphotransferase
MQLEPQTFRLVLTLSAFALPLVVSLLVLPKIIEMARDRGQLVRDYYKAGEVWVPTGGGVAILIIAMLSLSFLSLFFKYHPINYVVMFVVCLFGLFGVLDDMIDIGRPVKLVLMYYCSYPIIHYIDTTVLHTPFGFVELGLWYPQVIVPTYVLVSSNLVNMHSGFNGLSSGLSAMVLSALIIKAFMVGNIEPVVAIVALSGAILGFYLFERYPARIFWGNVGALTSGAAVGLMIVVEGFLVSGFVMLLPHTVNFLMYVYWRLRGYPQVKFGGVRDDGTLWVPNNLTLKWVLPYYFRMTEKQATYAMFALTGIFSVLGIFIPF